VYPKVSGLSHNEIKTTTNTPGEATQSAIVAKLTRLTHKIAVQLHLVEHSSTICSSHSRQPVQKLQNTPSYTVLLHLMILFNTLCYEQAYRFGHSLYQFCDQHRAHYCMNDRHTSILYFRSIWHVNFGPHWTRHNSKQNHKSGLWNMGECYVYISRIKLQYWISQLIYFGPSLMGCDTLQWYGRIPTFWMAMLPPSVGQHGLQISFIHAHCPRSGRGGNPHYKGYL
jgi:hypothetical protein